MPAFFSLENLVVLRYDFGMKRQTKKFQLLVLGCQMNQSDAERIEKILLDLGWKKTDSEREANLIIAVACSVRQSAIDRIYGKARQWQIRRRAGQLQAILTGCVLTRDKKKLGLLFDQIITTSEINKLPEIIESQPVVASTDYLCLPAHHESTYSAYVPISNGCNNFCAYCAVPYTRGREVSRDAKSVIAECQQLVASGYKEIILLGQNVNSYQSGRYDFPKLLTALNKIKGEFWVRFLTSHPKDFSGELIKVLAQGKHLTPYLHLALQSGDDDILKKMNRRYTAKHYQKLITQARKQINNLTVSTDIIVGFPGETKQQFEQTAQLMRVIGFDMAYLNRYSPRSGTAAAQLKDNVSKLEKKRREEKLNLLLKETALTNSQKYLGRTELILVDGYKNGLCFGKTAAYKIVTFKGKKSLVGQFVKVKITGAKSFILSGKIA